jgi:hypothetical protein
MTMTAKGATAVAAGFRAAADDLRAGMVDTNLDAARAIAAAVSPPVMTGRLAQSVRPVADAVEASVTAGGPGVPYARVQERRRHYLARALESTRAQVLAIITAGVDRRLDQVKGA